MRSFVKIVLSLLFLFFLFLILYNNKAFADTLLDSVELDSGYRNYNFYWNGKNPTEWGEDERCDPIPFKALAEYQGIDDLSQTWTYIGQGIYRYCRSLSESGTATLYGAGWSKEGGYFCKTCAYPSSNNIEECYDYSSKTILMSDGYLIINYLYPYTGMTLSGYEWISGICSLSSPFSSGYYIYKYNSSYTFRIECEEEKIASILRIEADEAEVRITSESPVSGRGFLMNGIRPFYIKEVFSEYWESQRVYFWRGTLYWDIPIYKRCGESVTVTPSLTSGYGDVRIRAVKAIFDCPVDINVTPTDVMPEKTGNNKADVVLTLSTPAPSEGVDVKLTVEPVKGSGGHIENGHTDTRPKGEITDTSGNKIDTIFFAEGETQKQVKYKATEIAGEVKIIAEIRGGLTKCEETVNVKVPGLFGLGVGGSYRLTGSTGTHPSNHYGTDSTIVSTNYMANDFYEQFNATLGINDMSLHGGGGFDIYGRWLDDITPPKCRQKGYGHCGHRIGTSVDIDRCALSATNPNNIEDQFCIGLGYPKGFIQVDRVKIREICNKYGRLEDEPTIHCEVSGAGSLIIPIPPIGGGGGDTGGGTVDGGIIAQ